MLVLLRRAVKGGKGRKPLPLNFCWEEKKEGMEHEKGRITAGDILYYSHRERKKGKMERRGQITLKSLLFVRPVGEGKKEWKKF